MKFRGLMGGSLEKYAGASQRAKLIGPELEKKYLSVVPGDILAQGDLRRMKAEDGYCKARSGALNNRLLEEIFIYENTYSLDIEENTPLRVGIKDYALPKENHASAITSRLRPPTYEAHHAGLETIFVVDDKPRVLKGRRQSEMTMLLQEFEDMLMYARSDLVTIDTWHDMEVMLEAGYDMPYAMYAEMKSCKINKHIHNYLAELSTAIDALHHFVGGFYGVEMEGYPRKSLHKLLRKEPHAREALDLLQTEFYESPQMGLLSTSLRNPTQHGKPLHRIWRQDVDVNIKIGSSSHDLSELFNGLYEHVLLNAGKLLLTMMDGLPTRTITYAGLTPELFSDSSLSPVCMNAIIYPVSQFFLRYGNMQPGSLTQMLVEKTLAGEEPTFDEVAAFFK